MSEVPLGAFLSGGVDSGLVVALMSEMLDTPVRTFTIGFSGNVGGFLDERGYARTISRTYGTTHTEFDVRPDIDEVLDPIVDAFDEPFADDSVVPTYYISRLARQSVTVALSGLGGDELFAGYERHLGLQLSLQADRLPGWLTRGPVGRMIERIPERRDGHYTVNHIKRFMRGTALAPPERYISYLTVMDGGSKQDLYSQDLRQSVQSQASGDTLDLLGRMPRSADSWLAEALRLDLGLYLPDDLLALTDRLSMAHGLEIRVPFLDHRIVEFAARLPDDMKIRRLTKKYLLRRVAERYLPPEVMNHRKQGFASPMASWLRADLRGRVREMLSEERLGRFGLLDPRAVAQLLLQHDSRQQAHEKQIFSVLMFQRWCERFLG